MGGRRRCPLVTGGFLIAGGPDRFRLGRPERKRVSAFEQHRHLVPVNGLVFEQKLRQLVELIGVVTQYLVRRVAAFIEQPADLAVDQILGANAVVALLGDFPAEEYGFLPSSERAQSNLGLIP